MQTPTQDEWEIAISRLSSAPDGTKLEYSVMPDGTPRARYPELHQEYKISHSFIKINGKIYALAQGKEKDAIVGKGGNGKVKHIIDQNGQRSVVKIGEMEDFEGEFNIVFDLGNSEGCSINENNGKYYMQMPLLGVSVNDYLDEEDNDPDAEQSFRMGINLCLALHGLHYGLKSRTHTPYIHGDLSPKNFVVTKDLEIILIDHGCSRILTGTRAEHHTGVYEYRPRTTRQLTDEQVDIESLLHSLYLAPEYPSCKGMTSLEFDNIFTHDTVCEYNLLPILDTSLAARPDIQSIINSGATALNLAANLINVFYKLPFASNNLLKNRLLCLFITSLYRRGYSAEQMQDIFKSPADTLNALNKRYPQAKGNTVCAQVLLINEELKLGEDASKLAGDPARQKLIRRLESMDLLRYYRVIKSIRSIKGIFINSRDSSLRLAAAKILLQASCYDTRYLNTRWRQIRSNENWETGVNLQREQVLYLIHKFRYKISLTTIESHPNGLDIFLRLIDYLNPQQYWDILSQCPKLSALILTDDLSSLFFDHLVKCLDDNLDNESSDEQYVLRLEFLATVYMRGLVQPRYMVLAKDPDDVIIKMAMRIDALENINDTVFADLIDKLFCQFDTKKYRAFISRALDEPLFIKVLSSCNTPKSLDLWIDLWEKQFALERVLDDKYTSEEIKQPVRKLNISMIQILNEGFENRQLTKLERLLTEFLDDNAFMLEFYPQVEQPVIGMQQQLAILKAPAIISGLHEHGIYAQIPSEPCSSMDPGPGYSVFR